jgi:hypothetical protein
MEHGSFPSSRVAKTAAMTIEKTPMAYAQLYRLTIWHQPQSNRYLKPGSLLKQLESMQKTHGSKHLPRCLIPRGAQRVMRAFI